MTGHAVYLSDGLLQKRPNFEADRARLVLACRLRRVDVHRMNVNRMQILTRGLTNRCPNCGGKTLFVPGKIFQMHETCPACGFKFEGAGGHEGFFLRATSLNFGVTLTCYLFPVLLLVFTEVISVPVAEGLAFGGALLPVILYRSSRSWSLLNYYIFSPQELPANHGKGAAGKV